MKKSVLIEKFKEVFGGKAPLHLARAPGRVNLIGAHTDYNEGLVLPVAVDREIKVLARPRSDRRIFIYSLNFEEKTEFSLSDIRRVRSPFWSNYPRGVAKVLRDSGVFLSGMEALIWGDVPPAAGMSSSAALEVASAFALLAVSDFNLVRRDLVHLCRKAENEFVGTRCGILDQFSSVFGKKGFCLLLDCRCLEYEPIPFPPDLGIVVANSMIKRELRESFYNLRRRQCEEGVRRLRRYLPEIKSLRDVSLADLRKYASFLPETILKRCRHVVNEIGRTRLAATRLKKGDLKGFGSLMFASQRSCRDLFETSSPELDLLVGAARKVPGVIGAKITGAGFGGCTVNLAAKKAIPELKGELIQQFRCAFKKTPEIYICRTSPGASSEPL